MDPKNKLSLSWHEVDQLVDLLCLRLRGTKLDVVLGISRAGLIPAVMLSHRLGIRDFAVLDIKRTESDERNARKSVPQMRGLLNESLLHQRHVLLVDDIVGEGLTLRAAREMLRPLCQSTVSSVLVVNQQNLGSATPRDVVDHHGCVVHGWIHFPWEEQAS